MTRPLTIFALLALAAPTVAAPPQPRGGTGIYDDAVYGRFDRVKATVAAHPEAVNEADEHGFTPLHGLAEEEHSEIAEYLVAHGADVNRANDDGITPLHLPGWPEMARLYLRHGAKLEARAHDGATPLVTLAAERDREDVMEVLLAAGADVHAVDKHGRTALDIALGREEAEKVALLRRYGAKDARATRR